MDTGLQERVAGLLQEAGVRIGGTQPQDIQVHVPRFFARVRRAASVGAFTKNSEAMRSVSMPSTNRRARMGRTSAASAGWHASHSSSTRSSAGDVGATASLISCSMASGRAMR